ncbi:bifunctional 2',3'-cyclic-nucleotide 2'-phosphodiesterase/3'-nucleotidase [Psychromonas ossibalaenae]|uniref:bifunctional 2',3'-cyclic-nucleotide 2'-phosphodiesterase/3'-nucleotidase n=1 Tax=Psychromonas ossibalaenae TaxID=444922 RepID=UPI00047828DB|nr:bifunctional 2',3'-cyclic-nucleotide 2'-phosphodiesterase/3'-nucleotidase [Psychromonas ossibalaenae]
MFNKKVLAVVIASTLGLSACSVNSDKEAVQVDLRILETTDLHANIMDFNYYSGKEDPTIGLTRTASLIRAAGAESDNFVLVDNGDLLQGSPMADYVADQYNKDLGVAQGDIHPAYKVMNTLNYAVGNIGNHEFNYGLEFLEKALSGAQFPYINANVYCDSSECWNGLERGDNLFTPYLIQEKQVVDTDGNKHTMKIGYIGFVPPQILQWDKKHLEGKVRADDIIASANKFIPEMKAQGADIIIAIPHSGIGTPENPGEINAENATYALSLVDGIDAIMFGHSHSIFPAQKYADIPNADIEKGTLNGVAAVMPGRWGDNLGVIDLKVELKEGNWSVVDSHSEARPIFKDKPLVEADQDLRDAVKTEHQETLKFVSQPIGKASGNMYSFLTLVQDDPTVQIVADAQIDKVKEQVANIPALKYLPVLSAAAPFKAGGRHGTSSDADQYVQVDKGQLTYKNAADLYLYPNTMVVVKATGAEVKDWLECSANQFNQIDPGSSKPQALINYAGHPTYNYDVIDGVTYQIDVTQPNKFDSSCTLVPGNEGAERISGLTYTAEDGTQYTGDKLAAMEFLVGVNNYRAFGGSFAGTGFDHVVLELPDENRSVLSNYITAQTAAKGQVTTEADHNWSFKTIDTDTALDVRFETQNTEKAAEFIEQFKQRNMEKVAVDELGFAIYKIDLTAPPKGK